MEKRRYALRLAYEGDAFRGWQRQPGMMTVQGCLAAALAHLVGDVRLDAAARTDAGVHALDQVVTFSARAAIDPAQLRAAVNARTPPALTCLDAALAPATFHARASASSRTYVYLVGWPPPPELTRFAWALPDARGFPDAPGQRLDVARAADAISRAIGEHDFAGLARPGEQTARRAVDPLATVRTVTRAEVVAATGATLAAFVLEGRGFLRAMVRNLVGMAVAAGIGAERPERVSELLAAPSVRYRGVRAPGWGLTLARVTYARSPFSSLTASR